MKIKFICEQRASAIIIVVKRWETRRNLLADEGCAAQINHLKEEDLHLPNTQR